MWDLIALLFIGLSPGFFFTIPLGSRLSITIAHGILFAYIMHLLTHEIYEGLEATPPVVPSAGSTGSGLQPGPLPTMNDGEKLEQCLKNSRCDPRMSEDDCKRVSYAACSHRVENPQHSSRDVSQVATEALKEKKQEEF